MKANNIAEFKLNLPIINKQPVFVFNHLLLTSKFKNVTIQECKENNWSQAIVLLSTEVEFPLCAATDILCSR